MKQHIEILMQIALKQLQETGELPVIPAFIRIETPKHKEHGDFASNIALVLAKLMQVNPLEIAERIVQVLPASSYLQKVEIAPAGFINFFLSNQVLNEIVKRILVEKEMYGRCKIGRGKRILVEFLSSNPTGPLHVGHGRHAAVGTVIANLLDAMGFKSYREYYLNDTGRQMDILIVSIWLRYLAICGQPISFPTNAYLGAYIVEIAKTLYQSHGEFFVEKAERIFAELPLNESQGGDKEVYIDAMITRAKQLLGDKYQVICNVGLENILASIREDLTEFGIYYDNWFSEREFIASDVIAKLIQQLKESGHVYEHEGALWLKSTNFADKKDRVLIRSNGQCTYFTNDAAYHLNKFERGFDIAIDILGADHHGHVSRVKAAMQAVGMNPERLIDILVQFVTLCRGGKPAPMSTRDGTFVTLRELYKEVGNDAARFFYVMRKSAKHMDFDVDLAKVQSQENPVYYVQYAYARIVSLFKQLTERNLHWDEANGLAHLTLLSQKEERQLLNTLSSYPDMLIKAALNYEPHRLTNYLRDLAADLHAYYNSHQCLVKDACLRDARLALLAATQQTLVNGFNLLGITAPVNM